MPKPQVPDNKRAFWYNRLAGRSVHTTFFKLVYLDTTACALTM
jgi:hypothetical protein